MTATPEDYEFVAALADTLPDRERARLAQIGAMALSEGSIGDVYRSFVTAAVVVADEETWEHLLEIARRNLED